MKKLIVISIFFISLTGCEDKQPEPEANNQIVAMEVFDFTNIIAIETISQKANTKKEPRTMTVQHHVKGNDVYVECIVSDFYFEKSKTSNAAGEGHIDLYLNDKKVDEISTAAFIVKGLPAGKHKIKIELVHYDSSSYNLSEEFIVTIKENINMNSPI